MQHLAIVSVPEGEEAGLANDVTLANGHSSVSDWLGIAASVGCAIHCAAMPFVIAFLPMLGLSFLADESFHKVMVGVCSLLVLLAFVPGWRVHRKWLPTGIAMAGLTLIAAAAFALEDSCSCCSLPDNSMVVARTEITVCTDTRCEHCAKLKETEAAAEMSASAEEPVSPLLGGFTHWITPLGGLLLVSAHLVNRRLSSRCGCCPPNAATA